MQQNIMRPSDIPFSSNASTKVRRGDSAIDRTTSSELVGLFTLSWSFDICFLIAAPSSDADVPEKSSMPRSVAMA